MAKKTVVKTREYTLEEIAKQFGMTKKKVRQIERGALTKLKQAKYSKKLKDYLEY